MARTLMNVTTLNRDGLAPVAGTAVDTANGNYLVNDGSTWLEVNNSDAAVHTLTVHLATVVDGQPVTDRTYSVAAGATLMVGPFPTREYGGHLQFDGDSNLLTVSPYRL